MQFNDEMDICPRCMVLFLAPKDNAEQLLASEDAVRGALPRLASAAGLHDTGSWRCLHAPAAAAATATNTAAVASVCPVCFDVLAGDGLQRLTDAAVDAVLARSFHEQRRPVYVNVVVPPAVDLARLTARLLVTRTAERTFSFPPLFQVVQRLVGLLLGRDQRLAAAPLRVVDDAALADLQVDLVLDMPHQTELCQAVHPAFKHKTKRRRLGEVVLEDGDDDAFEVSRTDADRILLAYKRLDEAGIHALRAPFLTYMRATARPLTWSARCVPRPVYLLGRYRKLARDVPQARWTLGDERKGRSSVEEIVSEAIAACLQARGCKMHPCGREDIDVRCLGNGRPFVVEVSQPHAWPLDVHVAAAVSQINACAGLNSAGDVEVPMLAVCGRSVWEQMQAVAEEKRKAYSCVCWSAERLTRDKLRALEALSSAGPGCTDTDEEGRPCLKVPFFPRGRTPPPLLVAAAPRSPTLPPAP
jgi:hypothetical protein